MKCNLKMLGMVFISVLSFSSYASNFNSMIEVLQTSSSVGKNDSKCDYDLTSEGPLKIKDGNKYPTYSLSISYLQYEQKKTAKVILVNEPSFEIIQSENGSYLFSYKTNVLRTTDYTYFETLEIRAHADGSIKEILGFKTNHYMGSPSQISRVLDCR